MEKGGIQQHITISRRDTLVNDLKNGTVQGILSLAFTLLSLLLELIALFLSYRKAGAGGKILGVFMALGFLFSVSAIILGIFGLRNKDKIRHYLEKRGILISSLNLVFLIFVYIKGLLIFLEG